ncbi:molybdopterin cofactor-binding domain-containing protein [Qaidamihabitans albus]|uniref:molybdopterin cofactor-binding domain-containing protein n=1 Tax=Qaidamihabitans albus TaxID=2795733 RepID=UPI0018F1BA16|nr:molybdopterin cofactor-binding domain-containing protein [Qaidamihabitans albus]
MSEEHPEITLEVNGHRHRLRVRPTTPLMYVLRNDLGHKGVRTGCSIGECGACRVLIDGASVQSCLTPVSEVAGSSVTTPEGLGGPESPHPVQQAFLDEQAGQCGYCVNGMIVSVAARIDQEPAPSAEDLRDTLDEHLCRCGTHARMLRAAARSAGLPCDAGRGSADEPDENPGHGADGPMDLELPAAVHRDPQIRRWVELREDGDVLCYPGKVELGQGTRTAFRQIVASQLGLPVEKVHACPTATDRSPDQGQTSGSFSMEHGGEALAMAAAALRRVLVARAARQLDAAREGIELDADGVLDAATGRRLSLAELAALGPVEEPIEPSDRPDWDAPVLGQPVARDDLRVKLTGAPAYVQDMTMPGMVHARTVLPPAYDDVPTRFDIDASRSLSGVLDVVQDGRLILVVTEREDQAVRAQARLNAQISWQRGRDIDEHDTERLLRSLPVEEYVHRRDDNVRERLSSARIHQASYAKPYQAHGPMAPSAALAVMEGDLLTVWTHSQGVYPLRREMAAFLDMDEEQIVVRHADGPGCYGMNCADDAAMFAAVAARAVPGRPVRFQFSMPEEFGWDAYGPGMVGDLEAALGDDGSIQAWHYRVISDSHSTRPNGDGDRLMAAWLSSRDAERPWAGLGEPSARNALPLYDVPAMDITSHGVRGPLRTGPLRSLGAFFNVFATESFIDELAERAGADPVAFRLAHLRDERAIRVLEAAAERAGWQPHVGPSGRGLGVAFARYKDTKAYVAEVAEVEVDTERADFRVTRLVAVCDAGTVVNRDGLRNQLEGGLIQGLSRTLHEELSLAEDGVRERDWTTYPTLRFAGVPELDVTVLDRPGLPPLGAGEVSTPPVPAAVANAIDDAIGVRLRKLPLTVGSLESRLMEMDEQESSRVLL